MNCILRALNESKWIVDKDPGRNSKKVKLDKQSLSLYWILPIDEA
ncbi:conserved protein of unknown function [Legionella micdadei]|uniref:Uncharacterized protein n=1 Tax=Legionella micdadei TaxID=451 RepID=A0A098GIN4_LEGMI|nr:conserved protein of unknown function [Legionella micdadei]